MFKERAYRERAYNFVSLAHDEEYNFVSLAHDEEAVDRTLDLLDEVLAAIPVKKPADA